jgi:hypothetical protein
MSWQKPDETYQCLYDTDNRREIQKYPIRDMYGFVNKLENGEIVERTDEERKEEYIAFKINELDNRCESFIHQRIGNKNKQLGYLGRFNELLEKRVEGENLDDIEDTDRVALKALHGAYKDIKAQFHDMEDEIKTLSKKDDILNYDKEFVYNG